MDMISDFFGGTRYFGIWYSGKKINYGSQIPVKSRGEVVELIKKYNGAENCGISISTFKDGVPFLLYLPSDFDSKHDIYNAWLDARKLYNFLAECGYWVSISYSGHKGFHVILRVEPYIYTRNQLRTIQMFFKKYLGLSTIDTQIMGDLRRLIRIPGTYNLNGGLCRVIAESEGQLFNLNNFVEDIAEPLFDFPYESPPAVYHKYPCIEKFIRDRKFWLKNHHRGRFEPHWIIRFSYVIEQLANGKSELEIVNEIEKFGWDDFSFDKTLYFINHIKGKGYSHPSCETIREFGFCLKDCVYRNNFRPKRAIWK